MKIITWNVNGIRAASQKGLFDYLREQDPDILCLQETKAHPDQLDEDVHHPEGRLSFWSAAQKKGYSGTVTYCKQQPVAVEHGIGIRKFDSEGRFVITDHKEFILFNVYFPNGGSGEERHGFKQEFLERFASHLLNLHRSGREIILVGDYNVAYLDIDVYDPQTLSTISGFLPEERDWFKSFLKLGFTDTFRLKHPNRAHIYTWWDYKNMGRISGRGWRIDHICVTPGLVSKVKEAQIHDQTMGSDHCPVMLELDL